MASYDASNFTGSIAGFPLPDIRVLTEIREVWEVLPPLAAFARQKKLFDALSVRFLHATLSVSHLQRWAGFRQARPRTAIHQPSTNTVAADYGSGYAMSVMAVHLDAGVDLSKRKIDNQ